MNFLIILLCLATIVAAIPFLRIFGQRISEIKGSMGEKAILRMNAEIRRHSKAYKLKRILNQYQFYQSLVYLFVITAVIELVNVIFL